MLFYFHFATHVGAFGELVPKIPQPDYVTRRGKTNSIHMPMYGYYSAWLAHRRDLLLSGDDTLSPTTGGGARVSPAKEDS